MHEKVENRKITLAPHPARRFLPGKHLLRDAKKQRGTIRKTEKTIFSAASESRRKYE